VQKLSEWLVAIPISICRDIKATLTFFRKSSMKNTINVDHKIN